MDQIFASIKQTEVLLQLGRTRIYELISDGTLQSRTIGRRRLVLLSSIRALAQGAT